MSNRPFLPSSFAPSAFNPVKMRLKSLENRTPKPGHLRSLLSPHKLGGLSPIVTKANPEKESEKDLKVMVRKEDLEEPEEDDLSTKHLAHTRFKRNNQLIDRVMDETVVPDPRSIVTSKSLNALRNRARSLTLLLEKNNAALVKLEEDFQEKKKKYLDFSL